MSIATRERPILFSSPMVKALLAGRKSMTRRIVKPQPINPFSFMPLSTEMVGHGDVNKGWVRCPYGVPGENLWVREAWSIEDPSKLALAAHEGGQNPDWIYYRDPAHEGTGLKWRPSIYMPRWASRITLEITAVRVERLQAITAADIVAEGFHPIGPEHHPDVLRNEFRDLWDKLNTPRGYPWESNPWVWVVSFRRLQPEDSTS